MVSLVQSLTLLFVICSLLVIIVIPILLATSDESGNTKGAISGLATFWGSLLIATSIANSFL
ncbi:photosystem II protein Z (chloroplast) [Nannochloropsis oceanica]|uniref:Photosystem II reaction center protein Z n=1 Tax=Nannochloropsis oceanica TaxID=145522 RepID=T1RJQ0_9STRA|nr:photosystem II protein Z [Nannochloropsis oceanica]AGI98852.1 photosystem II protein Z [Nannochloropsis oceanica]AGI99351.1 photosystem II protein Z [Nannochloropsis oceanica]AHX25261.1 photosystem II protein Z [Nannochloropsis oceanica]